MTLPDCEPKENKGKNDSEDQLRDVRADFACTIMRSVVNGGGLIERSVQQYTRPNAPATHLENGAQDDSRKKKFERQNAKCLDRNPSAVEERNIPAVPNSPPDRHKQNC
jgi:hypothetical protein